MKRREFITLFGSGAVAWPLTARAQQQSGRVYRVGYLMTTSREQQLPHIRAFEDGLRSLGYRVGENVIIEYRFASGKMEQLPALAADLVNLGVDVIVAGGNPNALAAMKASSTIPIVMPNSNDPVGAGLISSLARPGGNVTGLTMDTGDEIQGKRLELVRETLPTLSRIGVFWNPAFAPNQGRLASLIEAAKSLGLTLVAVEARGPDAFEKAFATMVSEQVQAFILLADAMLFNYRQQIGSMALSNRLPAASGLREFAEAGFLMTYGADVRDVFGRSAAYVDKILKGAKAADLPVAQPTKFDLVVNLKTAEALGLTVPATVLAQADEVIE